MSHELRTPLNAVIGFSEMLSEHLVGDLNETQDEYVRDIQASGEHLLALINDILDIAKVEAGRMELDREDFVLGDALEGNLSMFRERAARSGVALAISLDPGLGVVNADERKLKQVVFNLLSNAVKFTPSGGRVLLSAARSADGVCVSVADTGIGIPEGEFERIFEEFGQASGRPRSQEGTGLGLALARRFVELHGGRIWVESVPGRGSTFSFTLPVAAAGQALAEISMGGNPAGYPNGTPAAAEQGGLS
jgi:signal transduction histidine kinase